MSFLMKVVSCLSHRHRSSRTLAWTLFFIYLFNICTIYKKYNECWTPRHDLLWMDLFKSLQPSSLSSSSRIPPVLSNPSCSNSSLKLSLNKVLDVLEFPQINTSNTMRISLSSLRLSIRNDVLASIQNNKQQIIYSEIFDFVQ